GQGWKCLIVTWAFSPCERLRHGLKARVTVEVIMKRVILIVPCLIFFLTSRASALTVDMAAYQQQPGLSATAQNDRVAVAWEGADRLPMRLQIGTDAAGVPTIFAMEYQRGSDWIRLAHDLKPN